MALLRSEMSRFVLGRFMKNFQILEAPSERLTIFGTENSRNSVPGALTRFKFRTIYPPYEVLKIVQDARKGQKGMSNQPCIFSLPQYFGLWEEERCIFWCLPLFLGVLKLLMYANYHYMLNTFTHQTTKLEFQCCRGLVRKPTAPGLNPNRT